MDFSIMADCRQLAILDKGVEPWNKWREDYPEEIVDLSDAYLYERDLSGADLSGADLSKADLRKANLTNVNLSGATCKETNFRYAVLASSRPRSSRPDLTESQRLQQETSNRPPERTYTDLTGIDLTGAILEYAELERANLSDATLKKAMFRNASLESANLSRADATEADFQNAALTQAKFENATLVKTYFAGSKLTAANLAGARFTNAVFEAADLSEGVLSAGEDLHEWQLGKASLRSANMPYPEWKWESVKRLGEDGKHLKNVSYTLIIACILSWLTILAANDAALVTNSLSAPIPVIRMNVPITHFFFFVPLLLTVVYCYFHLVLRNCAEMLACLPAIFPDSSTAVQEAPWILRSRVYRHFRLLQHHEPAYSWLDWVLAVAVIWWLTPLTSLWFWARYARIGGNIATLFYALTVGFAVAFAWHTWRNVDMTFREAVCRKARLPEANVTAVGNPKTLIAPCMLFFIVCGAIVVSSKCIIPSLRTCDSKLCREIVLPLVSPNLRFVSLSQKASGYESPKHSVPLQVNEASLEGINYSHVDLTGAFLVRAKLNGANLEGADFSRADLRGAHLDRANLRGAILDQANLFGAILKGADLAGASLVKTRLGEVDLSTAKNLTSDQLKNACGDDSTKLPAGWPASLKRCGVGD
jgi:uncharacterized protein YjbI with pentapeptide repeats